MYDAIIDFMVICPSVPFLRCILPRSKANCRKATCLHEVEYGRDDTPAVVTRKFDFGFGPSCSLVPHDIPALQEMSLEMHGLHSVQDSSDLLDMALELQDMSQEGVGRHYEFQI